MLKTTSCRSMKVTFWLKAYFQLKQAQFEILVFVVVMVSVVFGY